MQDGGRYWVAVATSVGEETLSCRQAVMEKLVVTPPWRGGGWEVGREVRRRHCCRQRCQLTKGAGGAPHTHTPTHPDKDADGPWSRTDT